MPQHFDDVGECVETTLRRLGKRIVLALPLALGKPVPLANEFYHRACRDPSLDLRILTALSLRKPTGASELEKRFLEPFVARVFGSYPELDYVDAVRAGRAGEPGWQALRWDLEELRVSLFAQELGTRGGVSPKKLATRLAALG